MPTDQIAIVSLSVLAFTPWTIAGVMLISGKWRISTAAKPKQAAAPADAGPVTAPLPAAAFDPGTPARRAA